jgi:TRAP-type C4-dicarboxylate transport system permease small subunit
MTDRIDPAGRAAGPAERVHRALDGLYRACIWSAGLAIGLMSIIIPVGVFMRYVVGRGAQWPEPIAILLMMVFTFIGAAAAYRSGGHIAVTLLTDRLHPALQRVAERVVDLLMLLLCAFVLWYGLQLSAATMRQSISELPWLPVGVTYLPIPLGAAATLLFVLERMAFGPQKARPVVAIGEAA